MILHILFDPFIYFEFMRKGIVACCALSISITPIGSFLLLKRMSLIGDALSHSILPGVAIGYFFSGVSLVMMNIGGLISGLIVSILSIWVSEKTTLQQDASFSGFCIGFLALGVVLVSLQTSNMDLLNLLVGSILSVSMLHIKCIGVVSTITLISLALFYRALIMESFDPDFFKTNNVVVFKSIQIFFLFIVMLNLIASFQITGTLMSVGLMILPNLSAQYWVHSLIQRLLLSVCIALLCSWIGLLIAFYIVLPAGPTIILCISVFFLFSVLFGRNHSVLFSMYWKEKQE
ncbi:ABC transporter membrane protein (putative manganese transport system) [Candidatus Blochmanniella vafra str. BVAF]|uniref:ABC transporter membrane protein (Putative manganese transport system) n=1 Tax=Blochmanniella vafra (strain BVAF) TaxID=859654 RepID=E8Q6L3_BLOVB|nr:metal ABC transporter permease [Candidatus Blochmannia vafer]ADV33454.1 ABC transporter membrane protein (putative manganese transport system) [Candidatus Blochmannia vafer str. BVAF]